MSILLAECHGIQGDEDIHKLCLSEAPMITPYISESVRKRTVFVGTDKEREAGILSYGPSSYGYDIRLAGDDLKIFNNLNGVIIDCRKIDQKAYVSPELKIDEDGLPYVIQPPNSVMLGHSMEYFDLPRNITGICMGKSTLARVGIHLLTTPLEAGWKGYLVLEIANNTSLPAKIYPYQGIAQILFFAGVNNCKISYEDRGGKYQNQRNTQDALI